MKRNYFLLISLCVVLLSACVDDKKKDTPEVKTVPSVEATSVHRSATIDAKFKESRETDLFASYVELKTALVNTNAGAAQVEASRLMTAFVNMGVDQNVMVAVETIKDSDDIEVQRTHFVEVTAAVEVLLADAIEEGAIYKQYCPMAFNNTGAFWLSESKEIRNPYFGDVMLKCGRIDAELK